MFHKIIHIKNVREVRYGRTRISYDQTFGEIMALLKKHDCTKIGTLTDGDDTQIAFELNEKAHVFTIPKVYVNSVYDSKIGIRLVFRFLETLMEFAKDRVIDIEFLMLGTRMVETPEGRMTLKEATDRLEPQRLFKDVKVLPE